MTETARYWSDHLVTIAAENITTKAYAEREGLSVATLYYWRKRLKKISAPDQAANRKLVPVRLATSSTPDMACTLTLGPSVHLELPQLPDPAWLASLVSATAGPVV
jgi:hypothetical protein